MTHTSDLHWWQKAVFYQIYPRSFADGNGDGIGDVAGMIDRLDYLKDLGVDGVWLSPHFPSPLFDCGYDVSDYCDVAPEYGTLAQFQRFLDEAHKRNIRVILDMVFNHTSNQHAWFIESSSSRDNPKRDWYVWRDGKNGGPPNNWYSTFGGSAWELDPRTGQYYYHCFFPQQPDLNWRNPEVKQAMWDAVRFWLKMGVDGFRLDAIGTIYEDEALPDQQAGITQEELYALDAAAKTPEDRRKLGDYWRKMFKYQIDMPGVHDLMKELRQVVDEFPDKVLVGETDDIRFYGNGNDELHINFNFPLMQTERLSPAWVRRNQRNRLGKLPAGAWPCNTLGNHDCPRVYNRFGDGAHNPEWARINLALMLTLKGTPFLYNGEEIGMSDYLFEDVARFRDLQALFFLELIRKHPEFAKPEDAARIAASIGRDKNRTPMQWGASANAGFSPQGVEPWLPVNPNYAEGINVADQENDPGSLLNDYRKLLHLRRENPALIAGEYEPLNSDAGCLAFLRKSEEQTCLVVLNMTEKSRRLTLSLPGKLRQVFSTHPRDTVELSFAPFEVFIAELDDTK
jgi:alpha-glucosidase